MHEIVTDEPYEFVPPYHGRTWPKMLQKLARLRLRREFGVKSLRIDGIDRLRESVKAGHSVLLAPNHCRPSDPLVVNEMCRRARLVPFTMASWHLFREGRVKKYLLRRLGAFSVYREGLDRQSLQAAVDILVKVRRPLIIFPEGVVTRTNDRLLGLMEGVAFVARTAAKKRATSKRPGKVVILPIAIRYHFGGNIDRAVHETLDSIENRLSLRPKREADGVARIFRVGEALLWLKEIEYFGQPQTGDMRSRLRGLIEKIIAPIEQEWTEGPQEGTVVARVKRLRELILHDMVNGEVSESERERRWNQLADLYNAQQLGHYPPKYLRNNPSPERLLETVERLEEDLTDQCRIHRPMSCSIKVGEAIVVDARRVRGVSEDPVMVEVDRQLREMLELPADSGLQLAGPHTATSDAVVPGVSQPER